MKSINELYSERVVLDGCVQMASKMLFNDGFEMSVQASRHHYCSPRETGLSHYTSFEVGFPNEKEELLMPYIDGCEDDDPTETVYAYVPASVLDKIVAKHGGVKLD